ncbi:perlucin-like protein [Mytilus trossulus]|uniref:perlucin-like protein n=1 Tax=Mytilus trossulus TaxID=6551 RepID=UPI0030078D28
MAILGALLLVIFITLNTIDIGLSVNWHSFGSKKYMFIEHKLNWFDAQTVCQTMGGRLAHVMSANENSFLISITNKTTAWIGGADIHQEGDWRWYSPLTEMDFTYWRSNQPNQGSSANCMCYYKFSTVFKWADEPCTNAYYFVCEKVKEDQGHDNRFSTSGDNCMKICLQNSKEEARNCMNICL